MDAVVLVGGFGTRLRPLTTVTPKQMLTVGHQTMLEAVLERLAAQGVTRAVLSLGYKPEVFQQRWPEGRIAGIEVDYAVDPFPLDTAGAIRYAATQAGVSDTFVALNGDILTTLDLREQLALHRSTGAMGTLHLVPVEDPSRFGVVSIDDDHRILGFVEKPDPGEAPSNLINAGTYIFEPEVLDLIPEGEVSVERVTFPLLVERGGLYGYQAAEELYWVDAGTPEALLQANLDLVAGVYADPISAVGDGATVADGADLDDALVGRGVSVGSGTTLRRTVVMADAIIGADVSLDGVIVGAGATVGDGVELADTVVAPGDTIT